MCFKSIIWYELKIEKNNENTEYGDSIKNVVLVINDDLIVFKEYEILSYFEENPVFERLTVISVKQYYLRKYCIKKRWISLIRWKRYIRR